MRLLQVPTTYSAKTDHLITCFLGFLRRQKKYSGASATLEWPIASLNFYPAKSDLKKVPPYIILLLHVKR
jgi:hypothetical protein